MTLHPEQILDAEAHQHLLLMMPMDFTDVVSGLFITQNPLSLYTLYGVIALTGISVNSAIVLIDAANARLQSGMGLCCTPRCMPRDGASYPY